MSGRIDRLLAHERRLLAAAALLFAAVAPGALRLETDNSPAVWRVEGSVEVAAHRRFVERFGPDEGFRLVLGGPRVWSAEGLAFLARVEREAATLAGVREVSSLVRHHRRALAEFPPADLAALRADVETNALDRSMGWVLDGGRAASVLIETEELAPRAVAGLAAALTALGREAPPGVTATVVGTRSLELALDRSSGEIGRVFFPLLVLFAIVLLGASFRDVAGVVAPLVFVVFCEGLVLGALGWAGVRLNLVLAILPPVLFVIALATAMHVLIPCRALEAAGLAPRAAVAAVYRDKGRALVWAGVSTSVGFAGLAVAPVPAVAALGRWAALGLLVQLGAAFSVLPALAAATAARRGLPERAIEARLERLGRRLVERSARRRAAVLAGAAVATAIAGLGLARLERASDALAYLAVDHPLRREIERLEAAGLGLATLELHLTSPPGDPGWRRPDDMARLADLTRRLAALDGVLAAAGAGDLVLDAASASPFAPLMAGDELFAAGLELLAADGDGEQALARFVSVDGRHARLTLFVRHAGYEEIDPLAAAALAEARRSLPEGAEVEVTGFLPVLLALHRNLLSTLGRSLALTVPVLALTFALLLRRMRDTARALVPNLLPVVVLLGGMGWAGVPLDVATAMVASIVLGLVVDDTIHTLAHYRESRREVGAFAAVADRLERTAPAYLLTGSILAAGFGVCALSDFAPIARFGALSAAAIALAVVADLLLVPALFARD